MTPEQIDTLLDHWLKNLRDIEAERIKGLGHDLVSAQYLDGYANALSTCMLDLFFTANHEQMDDLVK